MPSRTTRGGRSLQRTLKAGWNERGGANAAPGLIYSPSQMVRARGARVWYLKRVVRVTVISRLRSDEGGDEAAEFLSGRSDARGRLAKSCPDWRRRYAAHRCARK